MLDLFNLPKGNSACDVQVFQTTGYTIQGGGSGQTGAARWVKPRGCQFVYIFAASGGGGGGGGASAASGTVGGGGGGGQGTYAIGLFPAILIPDYLLIDVAIGGSGGAALGNGTAGGATQFYWPTVAQTILTLGGGGAGNAGTTSAGGSGVGTGTTALLSGAFAQLGIIRSFGGVTSGAGTTSTNASNANSGTGIGTPGAGGGGSNGTTDGSGGSINAPYPLWPSPPVATGGTTTNGADGFTNWPGSLFANAISGSPFWSRGGSGGSGNHTGNGGNGGNGGIGSGGGGGGGGITTGGSGGRGGDGLVVIICS